MQIESLLSGLNDAAKLIQSNNAAQGFWDKERNVGELLMLVTSELGEAMEAHRKGRFANTETYDKIINSDFGLDEERTELALSITFKTLIKDTFEDEIADAVIRLLDLAGGLNIDLEKHIAAKVKYNQSRPRLHGKKY